MAWPIVIPIAPKRQSGSIETSSAIQDVRASLLTPFAIGSYLTTIGQNYGVPRAPQLNINDDTLYRSIIPVLAWSAKTIKRTTYTLLNTIFGTQAAIAATGHRPWRVYEVSPNEIVFEIPVFLIATTNENASYLHGWSGYALNATGSSQATCTAVGDVRTASALTIAGSAVFWIYTSGVWSVNTPSSVTYSAVTNLTTITLPSAVIPSGGCPFFVDIAGDNATHSFRGDYLASGSFSAPFFNNIGDPATELFVSGDITQALNIGSQVALLFNGVSHSAILALSPVYNTVTNLTFVTITVGITTGVSGILVHPLDVADGTLPPTAPHNDRVYLAGFGLYDVFKFYYDLLVRAAGIVVRLELVTDYTHVHRSIP